MIRASDFTTRSKISLLFRPRSRNTDHMPQDSRKHPQPRLLTDERLLRVLHYCTRRVAIATLLWRIGLAEFLRPVYISRGLPVKSSIRIFRMPKVGGEKCVLVF